MQFNYNVNKKITQLQFTFTKFKKQSLILHTSLEDIALFLNLKYVGFLWCVVVFFNFTFYCAGT